MKRLPSVKTIAAHFRLAPEDFEVAKKVRSALEFGSNYKGAALTKADHPLATEFLGEHEGSRVEYVMKVISHYLDLHGVESLQTYTNKIRSLYFGGFGDEKATVALYVNCGDTYDPTLLYDVERRTFLLTSYGDWVETAERKGRYKFA